MFKAEKKFKYARWWCTEYKKNKKKIHARENTKKKNSSEEEGEEKKFMQKEGPIVTFIFNI